MLTPIKKKALSAGLAGVCWLFASKAVALNTPEDPWEAVNKPVFVFNTHLDRWALMPVAKLYHHLPDPVETGVSNFFKNLQGPANIANNLLQGKVKAAGLDAGRLVVNTTLGLGGILNAADDLGIKSTGGEDFGQTLRVWGVPSGPYLMLPFLGPSTVTDLIATPVDWLTSPTSYMEADTARMAVSSVSVINKRAGLLDAEYLLPSDDNPDIQNNKRYTAIRSAYLQNRTFKAQDGKVQDDFGADAGFDQE